MADILLPQFGMGMQEATLVAWHVAVGDQVKEGDILADFEAAKATVEVPAPLSGTISRLLVAAEDTVPVRAVIATIDPSS
jgi:pyruvate/2-oxoglutarate dehydrogenase complex dihydrolipoamide acyltransferase (E2) component